MRIMTGSHVFMCHSLFVVIHNEQQSAEMESITRAISHVGNQTFFFVA